MGEVEIGGSVDISTCRPHFEETIFSHFLEFSKDRRLQDHQKWSTRHADFEETVFSHFLGSNRDNQHQDTQKPAPYRSHAPNTSKSRRRRNRCDNRSTHARLNQSRSMKREMKQKQCTYLIDAICRIIRDRTGVNIVRRAIKTALQREGVMSIKQVCKALAPHGMELRGTGSKYHQTGGPHFNVLQEIQCQLIIELKFNNGNKGGQMHRFVSWDGSVLHNAELSITVDAGHDRSDARMCKKVFNILCDKLGYQTSQICQIYELVQIQPVL